MARGYIRKRGDRSWQIVYDVPRAPTAGAASASRPSTATSARPRPARLAEIGG